MCMFAAVDTVEPPIFELDIADFVECDTPWQAERRSILEARVRKRLDELVVWLADHEWMEGEVAAGDLMMVTVLRRLHCPDLLEDHPKVRFVRAWPSAVRYPDPA